MPSGRRSPNSGKRTGYSFKHFSDRTVNIQHYGMCIRSSPTSSAQPINSPLPRGERGRVRVYRNSINRIKPVHPELVEGRVLSQKDEILNQVQDDEKDE